MKKKRRHLTPNEIKSHLNALAREKRMVDRSPWSAMSVMCPYALLRSEGFKGKRILRVLEHIKELEEKWYASELDLDELRKRVAKVSTELDASFVEYTEADITARKGSFDYWFDKIQLEPQNAINRNAERYIIFFMATLMDEFGYGEKRLLRVTEYLNKLMTEYREKRTNTNAWKEALYDEVGICIEMPVDPLTQTYGSVMTGQGG